MPRGESRLQRAIRKRKSVSTILELIKLFPMDVKHKNELGYYALHTACRFCYTYGSDDTCNEYSDVVIRLIELFPEASRHKVQYIIYPIRKSRRDQTKQPDRSTYLYPLNIALMHSSINDASFLKLIEVFPMAVSELIEILPMPVTESKNYWTSLHLACRNNRSHAVTRKLLEINPLVIQEKDDEGRFPIHCAICKHQQTRVIKLLLDLDPIGMQRIGQGNFNDHVTPFHIACELDRVNLVEYLVQRLDLKVNIRDSDGKTPLHYACEYHRHKIVDMLLNHPDVDVNARDSLNDTPLHHAATLNVDRERPVEIFQKLLDHPFILINQKNNKNQTPLDLIKFRVNISEKQRDELTGNQKAELQECMKMIHLLEEFPIKQRWQAYFYHFNKFMNL